MLIGLVSFCVVSKKTAYTKRDLLFYNDLLYQVENDMEQGVPREEIESRYGCKVILAKEINDPELSQLYSNGALVLDLSLDGEYVGKVEWNDM